MTDRSIKLKKINNELNREKQRLVELLINYKKKIINQTLDVKIKKQIEQIIIEIKKIDKHILTINFIEKINVDKGKTVEDIQLLIQEQNIKKQEQMNKMREQKYAEVEHKIKKLEQTAPILAVEQQEKYMYQKIDEYFENIKKDVDLDENIVFSYIVIPESRYINNIKEEQGKIFKIYEDAFKEYTTNDMQTNELELLKKEQDTKPKVKPDKQNLPISVFINMITPTSSAIDPIPQMIQLGINQIKKQKYDFGYLNTELDVVKELSNLKDALDNIKLNIDKITKGSSIYDIDVKKVELEIDNKRKEYVKDSNTRKLEIDDTNTVIAAFGVGETKYNTTVIAVATLIADFKIGNQCADSTELDAKKLLLNDHNAEFKKILSGKYDQKLASGLIDLDIAAKIAKNLSDLGNAYKLCCDTVALNKKITDIAQKLVDLKITSLINDFKLKIKLTDHDTEKVKLNTASTELGTLITDLGVLPAGINTTTYGKWNTLKTNIENEIVKIKDEITNRDNLFNKLKEFDDWIGEKKTEFNTKVTTSEIINKIVGIANQITLTTFQGNEYKIDIDMTDDYLKEISDKYVTDVDIKNLIDETKEYESFTNHLNKYKSDIGNAYNTKDAALNLDAAEQTELKGLIDAIILIYDKIRYILTEESKLLADIGNLSTTVDLNSYKTIEYKTIHDDINNLENTVAKYAGSFAKVGDVYTKYIATGGMNVKITNFLTKLDTKIADTGKIIDLADVIITNIGNIKKEIDDIDMTKVEAEILKRSNKTDLENDEKNTELLNNQLQELINITESVDYATARGMITKILRKSADDHCTEISNGGNAKINKINQLIAKQKELIEWSNSEIKYADGGGGEYITTPINIIGDYKDNIEYLTKLNTEIRDCSLVEYPDLKIVADDFLILISFSWGIINGLSPDQRAFIEKLGVNLLLLTDPQTAINAINTRIEEKEKKIEVEKDANKIFNLYELLMPISNIEEKIKKEFTKEKIQNCIEELASEETKINNIKIMAIYTTDVKHFLDNKLKDNNINYTFDDLLNGLNTDFGAAKTYLDASIAKIDKLIDSKANLEILGLYVGQFSDIDDFKNCFNAISKTKLYDFYLDLWDKLVDSKMIETNKIIPDLFYYLSSLKYIKNSKFEEIKMDSDMLNLVNIKKKLDALDVVTKIKKSDKISNFMQLTTDFDTNIKKIIKEILNSDYNDSTYEKLLILIKMIDLYISLIDGVSAKAKTSIPMVNYDSIITSFNDNKNIAENYRDVIHEINVMTALSDNDLKNKPADSFEIKMPTGDENNNLYLSIANKIYEIRRISADLTKKENNAKIGWIKNSCYVNVLIQLYRYIYKHDFAKLKPVSGLADEYKYISDIIKDYNVDIADKNGVYDVKIGELINKIYISTGHTWGKTSDASELNLKLFDNLFETKNFETNVYNTVTYNSVETTYLSAATQFIPYYENLQISNQLFNEPILITKGNATTWKYDNDVYRTNILDNLDGSTSIYKSYAYNKYIMVHLNIVSPWVSSKNPFNLRNIPGTTDKFTTTEYDAIDKKDYDIVGMVMFLNEGHYTCILKELDGWYEYDDIGNSYAGTVTRFGNNYYEYLQYFKDKIEIQITDFEISMTTAGQYLKETLKIDIDLANEKMNKICPLILLLKINHSSRTGGNNHIRHNNIRTNLKSNLALSSNIAGGMSAFLYCNLFMVFIIIAMFCLLFFIGYRRHRNIHPQEYNSEYTNSDYFSSYGSY